MTHSPVLQSVCLPPALKDAFALPAPEWIDNMVLAPNVAETYTVPVVNGVKAQILIFSATADFYAAYQYQGESSAVTAVVPSTEIATGLGSELNPQGRYVGGTGALVEKVSLISAVACIISIVAYLT